jgi:hypothetical protein
MTLQLVSSAALASLGLGFLCVAVVCERRMHAHCRPGVTYAQATLRRDGGWRRADLFTEAGLRHQRRASLFGVSGAGLLLAAILTWIALGAS